MVHQDTEGSGPGCGKGPGGVEKEKLTMKNKPITQAAKDAEDQIARALDLEGMFFPDLDMRRVLERTRFLLGQDVYAQGMPGGDVALWLRLGSGSHTVIGYGKPEEALEQAQAILDELRAQAASGIEWFRNK